MLCECYTKQHLEYKIPVSKFIGMQDAGATWRQFVTAEMGTLDLFYVCSGPIFFVAGDVAGVGSAVFISTT